MPAERPAFSKGAGAPAVSGDGKAYAWHSEGGGGLPDADPYYGNLFLRDLHGATPTTEPIAHPPGSEPFVNAGAATSLARSARTDQRRRLPGPRSRRRAPVWLGRRSCVTPRPGR